MDRLNSILVGVDFSDSSVRAVGQALRLAQWNGAAMHVFHVASKSRQAYIPSDSDDKLQALLEEVGADQAVTREVIVGPLLDETLRLVRERSADLLAIGAFGPLGQFTGSGVGVFAAQCMRHVPCKVLAVHEAQRGPFHRVLAAVDLSSTAARALQAAVRIVRQERGELHVLHVADDDDDEPTDVPSLLDAMVQAAAGDVADLDYRCIVLDAKDPGDKIIRYARKIEAHLITMGSRGKTGLEYILSGNTCDRVLRAVRRSVLVEKPVGFVAPADR